MTYLPLSLHCYIFVKTLWHMELLGAFCYGLHQVFYQWLISRHPDPLIKANDTIKIDLETNKIMDFIKFDVGNVVMVTGGRNTGRVGVIKNREKHKGSFETIMYFSLDLEYTYVCVVWQCLFMIYWMVLIYIILIIMVFNICVCIFLFQIIITWYLKKWL